VWAGTLGGGLYGLKDGREIHFTTANGLADDNVLAVCVDGEDAIWASTAAGTVHRFDGKGVTRFDNTSGLPGKPVTAMIAAMKGGLWLGTQDGQILRAEKGKISRVKNLPGGFPVLALFEDEHGRLWTGTSGGGLSCLTGETTMNWNSGNGLAGDRVAGIVEDQMKNLWLATETGIYRANQRDVVKMLGNPSFPFAGKLIVEVKTSPQSASISGGTRAALSPDGKLWFATSEGLLNADTHQSGIGPSIIQLYILSAAINGQAPFCLLQGKLWSAANTNGPAFETPTDLRSLEIHFTALNFAAPGEIRFRHKLDGYDPDWIENSSGRSAIYGRLTHGHYTFRVAARNSDGVWQEAAKNFAFVVPTPFYLQTWAIGLFVLAAVALVAGIVRFVSHRRLRFALTRLEQQQSLERERMRIARDMHDEMGSKLTKISFLSEHAQVDVESAGPLADKINSIAQTSRELLQTMDEIVWVVNPHNDTLENLVDYLAHYAVEYFQNTPIECEIRLPQDIPHCPLSSEIRHNLFLTFEEVLNNVLKHSAATKVKVEMSTHAHDCEVKITDNGKGFQVRVATVVEPHGGRSGNGLKNMRQRLMDIGGECLITSQSGNGVTVTMHIRLNQKARKNP
jgi:signal transduction histidine kinase